MFNSCAQSLRSPSSEALAAAAVLFLLALMPHPIIAQCPPASIQNDFVDMLVAGTDAYYPSIGMSSLSQIIVAYRQITADRGQIHARRFNADGMPAGSSFPITQFCPNPDLSYDEFDNLDPSVAVSSTGDVAVAFLTLIANGRLLAEACTQDEECVAHAPCRAEDCLYAPNATCVGRCKYVVGESLVNTLGFPFAATPSPLCTPLITFGGHNNFEPSASIDASGSPMLAWGNAGSCPNDAPFGWLVGSSYNSGSALRTCTPLYCDPQTPVWCGSYVNADPQPCIARRSDGYALVAWSDPENPELNESHFNIQLRAYGPTGGVVGNQVWVNDTSTGIVEICPSDQTSPAVAIDDPDPNDPDRRSNVVVTWVGPGPPASPTNCTVPGAGPTIYARRFILDLGNNPPTTVIIRDPVSSASEGAKSDFIVNNQPICGPINSATAHPTVALTTDLTHRGRFIIGWNSYEPANPGCGGAEVHGQFFEADGRPMGCEFRMHKDTAPTNGYGRSLAPSARHTLAYGINGNVAAAYTIDSSSVWFSLIPADTAESLDDELSCCKGDVNHDGLIDGRDIQPFVDLIRVPNPQALSVVVLCPADIDLNNLLNMDDVPPFVALLLQGATCTSSAQSFADCNGNEIPDANDIADGTSQDCNRNFIPDECDIADETSADLNGNAVPDECEPDCNKNGLPDAWDITQETSADVNENGVPDECESDCNGNYIPDSWDISQGTSQDCNHDGTPDECEPDCNGNGKPDDCDADPTDPDGNGQVSPDCNNNQYPDECDLMLGPPVGSLDCNENGIPDECDIGSGFSQNVNANNVPDECEGGAFGGNGPAQMRGDGADDGGCVPTPEDLEAAWGELYEWCAAQCWGPDCALPGSEQYQAYVDKLCQLGLIEFAQ